MVAPEKKKNGTNNQHDKPGLVDNKPLAACPTSLDIVGFRPIENTHHAQNWHLVPKMEMLKNDSATYSNNPNISQRESKRLKMWDHKGMSLDQGTRIGRWKGCFFSWKNIFKTKKTHTMPFLQKDETERNLQHPGLWAQGALPWLTPSNSNLPGTWVLQR